MQGAAAAGGGGPWRQELDPGDYLRKISLNLVNLEHKQKQKLLQRAASGHQQQIQLGSHVPPVNAVHAIHGGNSSIPAMSQVASMMSTHGRQSSQLQSLPMTPLASGLVPNQSMVYPFAPNMHVKVKQEQPEVTRKPDRILNSRHASITPSAPGFQLSQQMVQSVATQNSKQLALQIQPTMFSGCNPISIGQPQGQPLVQPNMQQNPHLRKNARGTGMLPQEQMMVHQQGLGFSQQQMDRQKYQMLVAQQANVTKVHNGHPGAQNSQPGATVGLESTLKMHEQEALNENIKMEPQPMALPQQLITLFTSCLSFSATRGSAGEVDWREEMFQQIKPLKDAYLSKLMELDQLVLVPKITEKQLESLPKDKAEKYRSRVNWKQKMTLILKFLMLEKNDIPDDYRGKLSLFLKLIQDFLGCYRRSKEYTVDARHKSQISHGQPQIMNLSGSQVPSGGGASHQKQQEQLVHSQLRENIITTTPAAQQINSSQLLGVARSCFPEKSRGSFQSLPIDKLQECCTLTSSPVVQSGNVKVSSPSVSLKSTSPSPVATPAAKAAASSSVSVKSTLPSPVAKPGVVKVASPCASVNSTLPSAFADSASIQAASPCASAKSTLPSPFANSVVIEATSSVTNSGRVPVASPCPSVQPTSSENIESFSALLLQDNSGTAGAQAAAGGTATKEGNGSKQVTTTKPIMPASPLQAETPEDNEHPGNEKSVAKKPIDRLLDAVRTSSPAMLCSAANSVRSILNMNDWVPPREMDAFQDWAFFSQQCGSSTVNKMKRSFESASLCSESAPLGSTDRSCMTFDCTALEAEYSAERSSRRQKTQNAKDTLLEEINSANSMLLDTFISIGDDNGTDGIASGNGGTLIKLSYTPTSLAPDLVSLFATSGMLLVPADYPRSSPVLVCDQGDEQMRKRFSDISGAVDVFFRHALYGHSEPMSIVDMARAWDASVRRAVVEFAQRHRGGTFSSRYSEWTRC
ncbi:hypothetical protein BAE44_0021178 [Dichanthelium oligosanthes]|uniref:Mediator of RNA polymerase II transcription subunit 15a n=1 Tax=Dichanthelium oligosanthes TaxID=888268 RepID=A0A1E5UY33_9POAL|nr:hypothetical protein BAE44_0021178 [Dichanthelium oligosanthes]